MDEMRKLVDLLNKYAYQYYVLDNPTVSDKQYDELYDKLLKLEKETGIVLFDSPSKRVGGEPIDSFHKHKHIERLYSLDKATSVEEMLAFNKRIDKDNEELDFTVEYKFDGLTICLTYNDGKFVRATTRGNGIEGEDVTAQVLTIKTFPLSIEYKGQLEVQGEAIIRLSVLEEYNKTADEPLKNARNAVAGAIRNLDPRVTEKRKPEILFYNVNYVSDGKLRSQRECVDFLRENGFKVHPFFKYCKGIESVMSVIKEIENSRKNLDILTDGAVCKVDDFKVRERLGFTDKFPRWAIAFKFEAEETTTILKDVVWQVGRTGKLTPLGILEAVELGGVTVKKATLNNYGDIIRKKVKKGARVLIRRSNDVIPEILGTTESFEDSIEVAKPETCPYCGNKLIENGANLFCPNVDCKPRVIASLTNFASKNGMDIEGFSEMTAKILYENLGVKKISDLFGINREKILKLEGFKEAKTNNLLNSIEKSKEVDFSNFIYALGIDNVGKKTAKDLAKSFKNLEELSNCSKEQLLGVDEVGEIIADCVCDFFRDARNLEQIKLLIDKGVKIIYPQVVTSSKLNGKKFVLTGTLKNYTREQAGKIIENFGGEVISSVSKKTDYLLAGENAGSKLDKAKALGVKIISEEDFKYLIN